MFNKNTTTLKLGNLLKNRSSIVSPLSRIIQFIYHSLSYNSFIKHIFLLHRTRRFYAPSEIARKNSLSCFTGTYLLDLRK